MALHRVVVDEGNALQCLSHSPQKVRVPIRRELVNSELREMNRLGH